MWSFQSSHTERWSSGLMYKTWCGELRPFFDFILITDLSLPWRPLSFSLLVTLSSTVVQDLGSDFRDSKEHGGDPATRAAVAMLHQNPVVSDLIATGLSGTIALSFLRSFEETAKRHIFDQVLIYLLSLSRNFYKT